MKKTKAKKVSEEVSVKRLRLMRKRSVRGVEPYTVDEVRALSICSGFTLNEHIGKLFPLILHMVSQGKSIRIIELELGIKALLLRRFLNRNKSLNALVISARDLTTDDNAMGDYPL